MSIFMSDHLINSLLSSCLVVVLLLPSVTSIDTINSTHPLKDGDLLISSGEIFALGFFSLNNSTNRYVGIWYNKISERTIVWVANRDSPLTNSTGVLTVDDTGNLVIRDDDRNLVLWSTNVSATAARTSSCYGQLLDTGNLMLFRDGVVAWEGFDYPTDTMLPNMKLGWDRKSGLNRFLTSWKSPNDPGTGEYSHKIEFSSVGPAQLFLYRGTTPVWRVGTWMGRGWSGISAMAQKELFHTSFVDNQDEVTLVWGMLNSSIFSRMVVNGNGSGSVDRLMWIDSTQRWAAFYSGPEENCDSYNRCGSFGDCDNSGNGFECQCLPGFEPRSMHDWLLRDGLSGCMRTPGANICGAGDGFVKMANAKVPDTSTARVNMSVGLKECEEMCLRDCSCMGYASGNISDGGGCISWYGDMNDTRQFTDWGQDLYIRVDAAELARYSKTSKSKSFNRRRLLEWGLPSAASVVILIFTTIWCATKKRAMGRHRKVLFDLKTRSSLEGPTTRKEIDGSGTNENLRMFDLSTLVSATRNFDLANKLGEGGFGSVYKGQLADGQEIAVKRLSNTSGQGLEEFKTEVTLIAKLQHKNLVRLLGCCVQNDEKMLVYEYLQNKGLDYFLFDKDRAAQLDWRKRFEIVLGIVRGLLYLHHDSRLRIIHRDLKASNILLDASLNPKISDFGMARIFGEDQVEEITRRVVGTYGYMSPEYAMEGLFSIKSDVYSLGVLLLEIVSGRRNNNSFYKQNCINLIGHVWELWTEGGILNVVDPSMGDSYDDREVLRCIHVGLLCVQEHANNRPTMSEVAFMLSNETSLRPPKQPVFVFGSSKNGTDTGSASGGIISVNEVTMTVVEGR